MILTCTKCGDKYATCLGPCQKCASERSAPCLSDGTPGSPSSDTPESDAAWDYAWGEGGCDEGHLLDTMQRLERGRDEAISEATNAVNDIIVIRARLEAERDRARQALDEIYNHNDACRAAVIQYYGLNHDYVMIPSENADVDAAYNSI